MMISGIAAITGLGFVVLAKFITTKKGHQLRRMVAEAKNQNGKVKGELRVAESTKAVASNDLKAEERKIRTLKLQIDKYMKEIKDLEK